MILTEPISVATMSGVVVIFGPFPKDQLRNAAVWVQALDDAAGDTAYVVSARAFDRRPSGTLDAASFGSGSPLLRPVRQQTFIPTGTPSWPHQVRLPIDGRSLRDRYVAVMIDNEGAGNLDGFVGVEGL